ncbi:Transmembrane 62, partial, partial [Paramuricea clavata]
ISDIHISKFRDPTRQKDLKVFCDKHIDILQPVAVLVTGDIVDAKDRFQIGSEQYVEEWEIYQKILKESAVGKKTQWLDVRGNHDNFDVPSFDSEQNMFRKYSMSAIHADRRDSRSYQVVYETKFGKYSLNGVDPGLDPGPKRPFNFFGQFNE